MSFDDDNIVLVEQVTHRGIKADIYATIRGATHCDLPHEPHITHCEICGERIHPRQIFLVFIKDQNLGLDCDSVDEAIELARAFIDEEFNKWKGSDPKRTPLSRQDRKDRKRKNTRDSALSGGASNIIENIKKMGWAAQGIAILREELEKRKRHEP